MSYTIDSSSRLIGTPAVPLFNKGTKVRVNYTVNSVFYNQLTDSKVRSYDTLNGKYAPHQGDDMVALKSDTEKYANGTYNWLMPFNSMKYIEQSDTTTNTMVLEGYDRSGNLHQIRACHCSQILITPGSRITKGTACGTVSDVGVVTSSDNSHLHITYLVNGNHKSIAAVLFGVEPFPDVRASLAEFGDITQTFSITGYGLYVNELGLNVRSEPNSSSDKLVTVPKGGELKIREFLHGFQSDGYQWAATEYNGYKGYSQIDTYGYYTVLLTDTSVIHPETFETITPRNLYIVASTSGAYIRTSVVNGDKTFIAPGSKMKVLELLPDFQSDGYQWAKVNYNGNVEGYVQIDVKSWHYFQII